jgi:hypothetical protein
MLHFLVIIFSLIKNIYSDNVVLYAVDVAAVGVAEANGGAASRHLPRMRMYLSLSVLTTVLTYTALPSANRR